MAQIKQLKYFAGGEWLDSKTEKYMDIYNPSTGEVIAKTPCCTANEVEYAIQCAKEAFGPWSNTPVMKRVQVLYKFRELLIENMDELAKLNKDGTTVMLVTHDVKVAAKCTRVMYIVDGNIKGEYNLDKYENSSQMRERERALNNWLLELGW